MQYGFHSMLPHVYVCKLAPYYNWTEQLFYLMLLEATEAEAI